MKTTRPRLSDQERFERALLKHMRAVATFGGMVSATRLQMTTPDDLCARPRNERELLQRLRAAHEVN